MRRSRTLDRAGLAVAAAALLGATACAFPIAPPRLTSHRTSSPIVVVGVASGGVDPAERACERAASELHARLRLELTRREGSRASTARPAERVRDWAAADRELEVSSRELVFEDGAGVSTTIAGDAFLASRIDGRAFELAVERARAAGRGGPVRVAVVPLAVKGARESDARRLYALRDLYSATVRTALEAEGRIRVADERSVYSALDTLEARADRTLEPAQVVAACALLPADALAHGRLEANAGAVTFAVELHDGASGRLLGRLDGRAHDAATAVSLARRHALLWKSALGLGAGD